MKRVLCLLMVLVTMFGSTITVEAASSTKEYDRKFKAYYNRLENQVNEQYENLSKEEKINILNTISMMMMLHPNLSLKNQWTFQNSMMMVYLKRNWKLKEEEKRKNWKKRKEESSKELILIIA